MISRFEQQRYGAALGVNPTARRDDVIRLLQGGKTSDELLDSNHRLGGCGVRRFTDAEVRRIRAMYATGRISQFQLAVRFGVNPKTIWSIIHSRAYADVA